MGAQYVYNLNYFTGVIVAVGVYYFLVWFFPVPGTGSRWNEVDTDDSRLSVTSEQEMNDEDVGREEDTMGTKDV